MTFSIRLPFFLANPFEFGVADIGIEVMAAGGHGMRKIQMGQ